ncbi:MAG: helix-turn-helix domain-containing protein [Candidatus Moranbacteria bacterium]|nr:helix-turn-helix domain-containing protein [Candidatus Moranbacteria bacterium]
MVVNGNATQTEIVRAFGVSSISVKRWVKKYRTEGARGFF